ncbi:lactonase family protein [Chitinophaga ginsengisoli]|uniref:6-phosphogluconolactonase (Cycloisomerase 2 family) n=1 Tax=Chitinophaga ginsengisoli TaxID=363837 RepID=A0A2P8FTD0_9BACT|nr:lactonase family protein [Chitinophaga ginsengisoli]PSL24983.1 6-phosphogluconolactonase (cycloisomerase 2 family) [Chitinophaga ginsengisoli]
MLKRSCLLLLAILANSFTYAQTTYLFVGSYNDAKDKDGIYIYRMDMESGRLDKVCTFSAIMNPSYLTLSANGQYIYACTETRTAGMGSVSSYRFDRQQRLITLLSKQPSGGDNPVYLTVHKSGRWLVNGNYTGGSLSVFPLNSDGTIGAAVTVIPFTDSSITERQKSSHIHSTVFSPAQDYVFTPDLGADKIRRFIFDASQAKPLQADSFIRTTPGSGPRHFTFHPNGRFAYCIEELSGSVTAYKYNKGRLESLQRLMTHDSVPRSFYSSADIHISPDGRFLYASNRGVENNIAIYSIHKNGTLSHVGYESVLGDHPRNFLIDPSGKFLIVANQLSGNVVVFKRNAQTGLLTKTGVDIKIQGPSCLQIRTYND